MSESKEFAAALRGVRGKPATMFHVTIQHENVVVVYDGSHGGQITKRINTKRQFDDFMRSKAYEAGVGLDGLIVMCSSSIDWPDEWTESQDVIALCKEIRG